MAAGRGLRMMPITQSIPKPMIDINGTTLIAKSLKQLKQKIPNICITVGYKAPELAKHSLEEGASTIFNTGGFGNCWWMFNTLMKYIDEPVLVLTCDNVVELDLDFLLRYYEILRKPACMVVPVRPVSGIDGDYIFGKDYFVEELSRQVTSEIYCSGIQMLNPYRINRLVARQEDFNRLWTSLILLRELRYSDLYPNQWYAVNTLGQLDWLLKSNFSMDA